MSKAKGSKPSDARIMLRQEAFDRLAAIKACELAAEGWGVWKIAGRVSTSVSVVKQYLEKMAG